MKQFLFYCFSLAWMGSVAQKKETYYDHNWKPCSPENARFFSLLEKTDSGWLRKDYYLASRTLQMQAYYEDEACKIQTGPVSYYHANGRLSATGRVLRGKQEGICLSFHSNGMLSDSALFHQGRNIKNRFRWHRNGYMSDSITRVNDSTEVAVGWFDDGSLAYAGYLQNEKPHGKWKYYHRNGQVSAAKIFEQGKNLSSDYFDEKGEPLTDTTSVNRQASFKGGDNAWRKYLEKNLYWPRGLRFTELASITVMISFTVDENGKTRDVEVSLPFHPEFDKIAVKLIEDSPDWIPAISNNRKVKAWRRQPVTFVQTD